MNAAPTLLALLQSHADLRGDALAHLLPDRVITYRRFWSRIERASARLQGEWGVRQQDVVAYAGNAHPDAIVLYLALLRIGAVLLPLETIAPVDWERLQQQAGAGLIVHNEAPILPAAHAQPLSLLLADWCHFDPVLVDEDPAAAGLLLPVSGKLEPISLQQLSERMPAQVAFVSRVGDTLFDRMTLAGVILPALTNARSLQFSAVEKALR